ncbi:hypothetical protein SLW70_16110 [Flavobacterium sp. NG2]|uniref:hypothetical protein n=1 Tax=Flavobacterium sp. NG2 TaxID=3097547 RepID=UPI002A7FE38C|nr:hypothetical protein [Flavobacterium sp. NG2]WPR71439.1 hypothetical protein SLW70_16110 [Flavobacterium sp. NG2]
MKHRLSYFTVWTVLLSCFTFNKPSIKKIMNSNAKVNLLAVFLWILFGLFTQNGWSQNLTTATANAGPISTTSSSFVDVTGASVSISATAGTKVMVTASFSGKTLSGSAIATYRLVDDQSHVSGELQRTQSGTYGIGSVVYIFDVTSTGTRTYKFQHKTTAQTLETNVAITAVALYDGSNTLKSNVKTLSTPVEMASDTFDSAIDSDLITTTATGGFFVSASVQTANTTGTGTTVGEWVLQYKLGSSGTWTTFNYPVSRSSSNTGIGIVNMVGALPNNLSAGDYYFRVAHRKVSGTDSYETQAGNLVVVGLGTNSGYFPVMSTTKSTATNATASFVDVFNNKITPLSATSLFLQAQYNLSASAAIDAKFDLFAKQGVTTVLDGLDHTRNLSSSTEMASGTSIGLVSSMTAGLPYDIALRHASVGSTSLTTTNAYLVGFGTNRSSLPFTSAVHVYATAGIPYSSFNTLKEAFDAINGGAFNGTVTIQLNSSTTETATAELLGSGTGSANYNAVSIYPTTTGISITGNLATPLINLNGANNVIIDGRVNQTGATKNLNFINTNTAGSVVQFINDASNNTIKYCTIQGVTTSITSGLIVFSTGTSAGNDNNTIEYCDIKDGATTPANAIYSNGTSVVADNSRITISNNNIYNYFSATTASNGVLVAANSSAWTISGNRFYQTATRITTTTATTHRAINIISASGVGFDINSNIIGFANESETGFTTYDSNSSVDCRFLGIEMNVGVVAASNVQGNIISNINLTNKVTAAAITAAPGIFSGISILGGNVNVGTITGNTIGTTTGTTAINITSSVTLHYIAGIYATSVANVTIENNKVGAFSMGGTATIGFTFHGINTTGTGGNFSIAGNTIGSTTTSNAIAVGINGITTTLSNFNGISNAATGIVSITNNTIQNTSVYGTGASVYNGIVNSGGTSTVAISGNSIIGGTNTGTGAFIGISNTAVAATLSINTNSIRGHNKTAATGTFTAISNAAAVITSININNNQLGNADGGLITYTAANSAALAGISNTGGAASCDLSIQNNNFQGIVHSVTGSSAHTYISNSAATLTQNISGNTFTNLTVNTTGNVTFMANSNSLFANGVQTVNSNSIVGTFTKSGAGGTVIFCNTTGASSQPGSSIVQSFNNFSNVSVSGVTIISGWINSNSSLDKTISNNTFSNWTGGSAALTVMTITGGSSIISDNTISNMTTGTAAAASIIAISSGASDTISITNNTISNLVSGTAAFTNSFTGITNNAGTDVTISGNTITGCRAGGTGASVFTGITTVTAGSGTLTNTGNSIISGTNSGTGAFNTILNSVAFTTANISNNIIRNNTVATGTFTAISNTGAVTNTITINNNQLGNATGGLVNYSVASSATLLGVNNSGGTINSDLSIQNNDIRGITYSVAGTNANTYIINSATTSSQTITNNTFTNLSVNTTGAIIFISNNIVMPSDGVQNINYNSISGTFTRVASSGALTLFTTTAANSNNNLTVNNIGNNFSNITINGTATIAGWINTDAGDGLVTKNIEGNIFNNWNAGTGTITALTVNINSTDNSVKNNIISNITSAGTITGITTAAGNDTIFSNSIFNLISSGTLTTTVTGINVTAGTTKNIYSNTIYGITGNTLTTGSVRGIYISGGTTVNAYQNTIYGISGNAISTGTVSGIWVVSTGTAINIYRNKVYDISSTSTAMTVSVQGIQVSGATAYQTVSIRNNLISDIRTPAMSLANAVRGISVISTGAFSNINVYYNTIYLNATSTGTNFGSSGIYHTSNTTATTAALDLRNNIIVNISTANGTGQTVAFFRSSGTSGMLANYASTSNNNLFYAGTPGAKNLIYADGTSTAQTIAAYKTGVFTAGTIAPRDQASVSENPTFISTVGTNVDFMRINATVPTQIESGAVTIDGVTLDYAGQIRQGNPGYVPGSTTAPDLGAHEGNYTRFDSSAPSITYTLLTNTSCTSTQTISATITDATGVNTTAGTRPRIYYKKSTNSNIFALTNTSITDGWKYVEASNTVSPFIFNIDYSLVNGGVTTGSVIQYFVVAQDIVTPSPYVGINNGTFTLAPASVNLSVTAFPIGGTINSFTILAGLSNTKTVCTSGCDYTSLTGAGGLFSDINAKGLSSNLVVLVKSNTTETGANTLNQILYGCSSNYTLTIKPDAGVAAVLAGNVNVPLINLTGADNVIFDGLNTGGSSLTIRNTNTGTSATAISLTNDAINNTFTNCIIEGSSTSATSGVVVLGSGTSTGNDGNIFSNNTIGAAGTNLPTNAIYSAGSSTLIDNSEITISGNQISDYFSATLASNGIFVASNSSAWTISGNNFFQTATRTATVAVVQRAIQILTASGSNYLISNNIIGYANTSSTGTTVYTGAVANTFRGIEVTVSNATASTIQGNTIAGISYTTSSASALPGIFSGISVLSGMVNVSANTIGATSGSDSIAVTSTTTAGVITGIYAKSTSSVTIQNNNIGNISTPGTEAAIGYTFHGIYTLGGGQFTIAANLIGSETIPNSITIGTEGLTTSVCTLNGIVNASTGITSINNNTVQNVSVFGTSTSSFNGILNTGITDVITISGNKIIGINNTGITTGTTTKTGWIKGISNTAAANNLNITSNIIRNLIKTVAGGEVFGIANSGGVLTAININNNQLGNSDGGFISYSNLANSAILYGISNTAGAVSCALSIQNNNIQGINYVVAGTNVNSYIVNSAATLSQNISGNTFTNLNVNTTGSVTFITNSSGLFANGVQTVNNNAIVTAFNKGGAGGTVTFCNTTGTSQPGSVITQNSNNFSNVTVTGTTIISGWINSNTSLNKTISSNTFSNWTGGSAALTVMTITTGSSTISDNSISNMTTGTAAAAPIVAISSGATATMTITNNTISGLVTGTAAFVNSFTGITNNAGTDVTITGNTITGCTAGGTGASIFTGITTITAGSGTLTNVSNSVISGTNNGTGAFNAIVNAVAFATANINNNIIRNNTVRTGTFTGVTNSGTITSAININNNQLGNADGGLVTYSVASAATLLGISNTNGTANTDLSIQNNNIQGITYAVAGTNAHTYINNTATTLSQNISNNTFTNLSVNTTGAINFITNNVIMQANGIQNINNNSIVTAFTRTASSGAITLFSSTTSTNNSNVIVNNNNNNFSNITINGSATIAGWINTDAGIGNPTKTIEGNTFNNWTAGTGTITVLTVNISSANNATKNNTISNISSAGPISGITTGAGSDSIFSNTIHSLISTGTLSTTVKGIAITTGGTVKNIYQNTIYNIQANGISTGSVSGIEIAGGAINNLYNNKIHTISSSSASLVSGAVHGILVTGAVDDQITTLYNNKIGNIVATAANTTDAVRGISIANTGLRSQSNIYFNTVFLNATSSGTNFGSTGIYHTANTTSTTGALYLRNNIIVNQSTANGTGYTVAFLRSSGSSDALKNYSNLSNNNLFYAGVPSASNLIYSDGTSAAQTFGSYTEGIYTAGTIAPRDQVSVSEAPNFLSTDGTQNTFLKINSNTISFIESGGVAIAGITTDFDGDIRAGNPGFPTQTNGSGTAPDIGADEFDGKAPNVVIANAHNSTNGVYINLASAFTAINSYDQSAKNITISFVGSFTESTPAVLNAGLWTTLKMFPAKTGITITGSLDNAPLIDLNGADNVTIDGRVNQSGSIKNLSISNTSTAAASTATIRWINSAENNTIKYCNIYGSSTSTTSGVLSIGTSISGNGNDNNSIEFCNISNASGNRSVNALYSAGSSGSENNAITIRNNNFYDFLNRSIASNAIHLNSFTSDCTVTNNSFYETTSFVPTGSNIGYTAIRIDNTAGNNFTITNNFIGGTAASSGGTAWTVNALTTHSFAGMYLNVGSSTASSIQNNVIKNWNYTTASATPWRGIEVNNGAVNIGTVTANTIGATTGTGSIVVTSSVNAKSYAIYIGSVATNTISKNNIGSINLLGSSSASHSFAAIYKAPVAGLTTITSNLIGSNTTPNSIYCGTAASSATEGQDLIGIYVESSGTTTLTSNLVYNLKNEYSGSQISRTRGVYGTGGTITLTKNNIYNLSSASIETTVGSVIGVEMNGTTGNATVTESNIYNLSNTNSAFSGYVTGIRINGLGGTNLVNRNFIHDLAVHNSTIDASIYGIRIINGATTFANNIITLDSNTQTTIYGIYSPGTSGSDSNVYFNTVYIGGSLGVGATNKSYAFYENNKQNTRDLRNNIFTNFRSTVGGSSLHYGIYLNYNGGNNLTIDYNNYYAPGVGGVPGYYNGSDKLSTPVVNSKDSNSTIVDPQFILAGGNAAVDYKLRASMDGVYGTGIILDYSQTARGNPPNIGSWEFNANRWLGTISNDFGTAANWSAGSVPLEEASVVFALAPLNHCVLDMNRTVGSIVNNQSTYNFITNGHELTLVGGLYLTDGAKIDASSSGTKLIFQADESQSIPDGAFVGDAVPYITIDNLNGVTTEGSFTITETLNLSSVNPSSTQGSLDTGANTITLGANAIVIGDGDVTGIVKRTSMTYNQYYAFNNKNATLYFENNGNPLPTSISVKMSIGTASSWRPNSIKRIYEFIQTGANQLLPTAATISAAYLDTELNGNNENSLLFQSYRTPSGTFFEHGRSDNNSDENWVNLTNIDVSFFPATFGTLQLSLGLTELETLTWNGSVSTSWTTPTNWTPNGGPSDFTNIIIPNAYSTLNSPKISTITKIKTLNMKSGAIVNSAANATVTVVGGDGAWADEGGTFNSGTSTVIFKNEAAKFSGSTSFNNITIDNDAYLYMTDGSYMKIQGVMNNNGLWSTASGVSTTVEYNGGNQVVVIPNPATNRYSSLILSGTGVKTMPVSVLTVLRNLQISGTASVTANNNIIIGGNLTVGAGSTFNCGSNEHNIGGNIIKNGTFTTTGSTITLDGFTAQAISGSTPITFENLVVNNVAHVNLATDTSVNGSLTLTEGQIIINTNTLGIGGSLIATNGKLNATSLSSLNVFGTGNINFSTNLFTSNPSIQNLTLNRNGILSLSNQNLSVNNALSLTLGNLKLNNTTFTMAGNSFTKVSGSIDASEAGDTLVFHNSSPISLPSGTFSSGITNLTISGSGGLTSEGDITVNKILNLQAANPSATKGILDLYDGANLKNLTMGILGTTLGVGDVTGIVRRTSFNANVNYTFGNQYTYVSFENGGTYPTELKVKIQIGTAPTWQTLTTPIKRIYDFVQTGGVDCIASVTTHYLDSELNGNTKNNLVHWTFGANGQLPDGAHEWGSSESNSTNNWVTINNIFISSFPTTFGNLENTLASSTIFDLIWNGSISTVWGNLNNWTPKTIPSANSIVVIPDAASVPNNPTLASNVTILKMTLQNGAILNAPANASLTIVGADGSWKNLGGVFNSNSSTVTFTNANADIEGTTNFYNVVIPTGNALNMLPSAYVGIAGTLTNNGTINSLPLNGSTLDYNGGDQTVAQPNPTNTHYYNLNLSGTGIKTLPNGAMEIQGNLGMSGTVSTTVNNPIQINGNLNLSGNATNILNANSVVLGGMTVMNASSITVNASKTLSIDGTISNTVGTNGIVLKSNASGTASLLHHTNNVSATVERYISGNAEDWHFLSSPVSNQSISGNWTPSGTYGNGTGYDAYLWNEPTFCWKYKLETTSVGNWNSVHPSPYFTVGRGYLYSFQALNPTKEFNGTLNNGSLAYPITKTTTVDSALVDLEGFNLVGNPYPSSVDWQHPSGWSRTDLVPSGSGYDMWVWNPAVNNYGVCNSATGIGTNSITRYIAPMQGFFVKTATNGSLGFNNSVRVHTGASNWKKNVLTSDNLFRVTVQSEANSSADEVLMQFGNNTNEMGASKLFSPVASAPSLYLNSGKEILSVKYFTNYIDNSSIPLAFKAGIDGFYKLNYTYNPKEFSEVYLEDKLLKKVVPVSSSDFYRFKSTQTDNENRFVLHFKPIDSALGSQLTPYVYSVENDLIVDLKHVNVPTELVIYDVTGKLLLKKGLESSVVNILNLNLPTGLILVKLQNEWFSTNYKVLFNAVK